MINSNKNVSQVVILKNNNINSNVKETSKMEKIMTIEGMMCGH